MRLTSTKPDDLVEVASWATSPTEVSQWIVEDLNWPLTYDPLASLLAEQRSGRYSAWSARVSDRLVEFGALNVRHEGQVAELSHLLVKRHRHAVAIAVEVVRQLAARAFADPHMEVLRLQVYADDALRNRAYEQAGFRAAIVNSRAARVGRVTWDRGRQSWQSYLGQRPPELAELPGTEWRCFLSDHLPYVCYEAQQVGSVACCADRHPT